MSNKKKLDTDLMLLESFFIKNTVPVIEKNSVSKYKCAHEVYPYTNEPLRVYYDKNLKDKRVLCVTSSGDHAITAALAGSKDITCFDINRFCKYYTALKIAMIRKYNYDEYLNKMEELIFWLAKDDWNSNTKMLNNFILMLNDLEEYLSDDEKAFFNKFIDISKESNFIKKFLVMLYLDQEPNEMIKNNAYLIPENYDILKKELSFCSIKYVDSNINKLKSKKLGKFDVIYLSNLLSVLNKDTSKILVDLSKLLNDYGLIYDCDWYVNDYVFDKNVKKHFETSYSILKDTHVITTFIKKK